MYWILYSFVFIAASLSGQDSIFLKDNLRNARPGDFIVAVQNKSYTLLHIYNRNSNNLVIEEITIPVTRINLKSTNWRSWVGSGAIGSTAWILYSINLNHARPQKYFSVTKNGWFELPERENFMSTLLNLRMDRLSFKERKKMGIPIVPNASDRQLWQPKLFIDGHVVADAEFDAWRAKWPLDGSELGGKVIEIYTPKDPRYPAYFPYWLQISGVVGNAKIRIIDSGSDLISPAPVVFDLSE